MITNTMHSDLSRPHIMQTIREHANERKWPFEYNKKGELNTADDECMLFIKGLTEIDDLIYHVFFPSDANLTTRAGFDYIDFTISELREKGSDSSAHAKLIDKLKEANKTLHENASTDKRRKSNLSIRLEIFRALIEYETDAIASKDIRLSENDIKSFSSESAHCNSKAFLSHQYRDKLYAIGLYLLFRDYGVHLYVDWMHNGIIEEGCLLKQILRKEIIESKKFVLLPHYKLPFGRKEDLSKVSAWCAWEMGVRYEKAKGRPQQNYYVDLGIETTTQYPLLHSLIPAQRMDDFF